MVDIPFPLIDLALLQVPFHISLFAFVFCNYLTETGEILEFWPNFADKITVGVEWLRKPLYACDKCQAGSLTLITSLFLGFYWQSVILAILAIFIVLVWRKIAF